MRRIRGIVPVLPILTGFGVRGATERLRKKAISVPLRPGPRTPLSTIAHESEEITMTRIPLAKDEELTPAQLEFFRVAPAGKLNLARLLAHGTTVFLPFMEFAKAIFAKLDIPPREREIIALAVQHLERSKYEWAQHVEIAEDMGISRDKIDAIDDGRFNAPVFNEREIAILAFTRQVVRAGRVDDYVFGALSAFYSSRQIVEAIYTIGCYMMVVRVSEVAEIEIDAVHGAEVVRQAVAEAK